MEKRKIYQKSFLPRKDEIAIPSLKHLTIQIEVYHCLIVIIIYLFMLLPNFALTLIPDRVLSVYRAQ